MKNIVLFLFAMMICLGAQAQKVSFGLAAAPAITWAKAFAPGIESGKVRMGVDYGLLIDINLADNYALSTGTTIMLTGGNLEYQPGFPLGPGTGINARFRMQYLQLPILFKPKTNQIGYITYFGSFGVVPAFRIQARVSATDPSGNTIYDDLNLIRGNTTVFKATVFQLGLQIGGGIEYALNDKTALLIGLFYHNAFVNAVKDGDNEKVLFNHVALRTGIMF